MINDMNLALGISTVASRHNSAIALEISVRNLFDEIVIVVQNSDKELEEKVGNTLTIFTRDTGLSKSRNMLLSRAASEWLWINDDDVELLPDHVSTARTAIANFGSEFTLLAGRIGCIGCAGSFKKYRFRWFRPLLFVQVSSVEMIVNRAWCEGRAIKFDPVFGLGTNFPVAEEPIFASDIVKAGGKIKDINVVLVNHPCNEVTASAWKGWGNIKLSTARGRAARRIGGQAGFVILLFWMLSALVRGKSLANTKIMFNQYMRNS